MTKMKAKNFIYYLLGLIVVSCIQQPENEMQVLKVNINANQGKDFEKEIEIKEVIPLDNVQPIGSVRKVLFHQDKYFILDNSSDQIFCFDGKGHLDFKISDKGKGPNEYISIQNFFINSFDKQLEILSGDGKVLEYTTDGVLIGLRSDSCGFDMVMDGIQLSSESVAFYGLGPTNNLYVQANNSLNNRYFVPFVMERDMSFSDKAFSMREGSALFCHGMNDSIYEVSSAHPVRAKYYVDFEQNKINPELYINTPAAVEKIYKEKIVATKLDDLNESLDFLFFSYLVFDPANQMDVKKQFVAYEKKQQQLINFQEGNGLFPIYDIIHDQSFLSLVFPVQIMDDGYKSDVEKQLAAYMKDHNIKVDSNPLILIWGKK